jgi:undecaprenyl-diphosphatase
LATTAIVEHRAKLLHDGRYHGPIDFEIFHALNATVATRDWLEDPVTVGAAVLVPAIAAITFALWFVAQPYGDPRWKRACLSALTSASLALAVNQIVAHVIWARERPFAARPALTHLLAARSPDPSFPSDHAAAAFAIAVSIFFVSRRVGAVALAVATLIALSRVLLGVHYPSDVIAGAAVGALSAIVVARIASGWVAAAVALLSRVSDPIVARARSLALRG